MRRALTTLAVLLASCGVHAAEPHYLVPFVGPDEGFNLRRDALMRAVVVARDLGPEWTLVLPPLPRMRHWTSRDAAAGLGWEQFLDLRALREVVPLVTYDVWRRRTGGVAGLGLVLESPATVPPEPSLPTVPCGADAPVAPSGGVEAPWRFVGAAGEPTVPVRQRECLRATGHVGQLAERLQRAAPESVLVARFERVAWDGRYDGPEWWTVRRALRFSERVVYEARRFRAAALPGPYAAVHLRRGDFVSTGRAVPSIPAALAQVAAFRGGRPVFLATDAQGDELAALRRASIPWVRYAPPPGQWPSGDDGAIAAIDQLLAAEAEAFMGTAGSTFSTVIMEERTLRGSPAPTTWRVFCVAGSTCEQPAARGPRSP